MRNTLSAIALPAGAMLAALLLFGVLVWFAGVSPLDVWLTLFKGAFGDWFSWQNTLQRAAPLMLTALCVAIPARAGLVIIGGEGALVLGGLACAALPYAMPLPGNLAGTVIVCAAGAVAGGLWIALAGWLRQYRGINETISSLLLAYVAIGLFKHFVEGPLRDPASLNKPSTHALAEGLRIGGIAGSDVHWGFILGVVACVGLGLWLRWTPGGFAVRVVGGNPRTAQLVGLPATRLILIACAVGGACAGLAGAVEVAAVHNSANASIIAGYGYAGILVSFMARHNPVGIIPVAILFGGFGAAGSLLQRRLGLPDASVLVLQGLAFVLILASESLRGKDWGAFFANFLKPATPAGGPAPAQASMGDKIS
jgi:simple sugar transport system permease protein